MRPCDGACCVESPRFPNRDETDCIYHDDGCALMRGAAIPDGKCPVIDLSAGDAFRETCLNWPQNSEPGLGATGACCWQWVDDGN